MTEMTPSVRTWPRMRLRLRAVVSTTMVIGWLLAALGGVLPYYFLPRGQGSSGEELLGMGRSVWISLHLWLSVGMVLFTLVHVLLNRRGVTRSWRVVSASRLDPGPAAGGSIRVPKHRRLWGWAVVVAVVAGLIVGGLAFAADTGSEGGWGRERQPRGAAVLEGAGLLPAEAGMAGEGE